MKRLLAWGIAGALVLAAGSPAPALDTPNERVTLAGVTAVHLVVDDVAPDATRAGLTRASLQADVERQLRQAFLRVLTAGEALGAPGRPTLHLRVELVRVREAPPLYVYSVDLTLRQRIQLTRDRTIESQSITWSQTRQVGATSPERLDEVREVVRAKVEQFLKAWQTVNEIR